MTRYFLLFLISLLVGSCSRIEGPAFFDTVESIVSGNGFFVVNEGNFRSGNGSLSFYSYDSSKIHNDIFRKITGRPLGDIPNSMQIHNDKAYIVVNNSGKIEVVERITLKSVTTVSGLISPRNICIINENKAYVTSMYSDSVVILNLKNQTVSGYINIRRSSESAVLAGRKAFIASWVGGREVMVINTDADMVIDSITVGNEPESMEIDKNNTLWVLCNGGWNRQNNAELIGLDIQTHTIRNRLTFASLSDSPSCLKINGSGDTLFYLDKGIRQMSIGDTELPAEPLIQEDTHLFYRMGINPLSGEIIVTDAVDYQQSGYFIRYNRTGQWISSSQAGIIPGSICFKVQLNPVIE